MENTLGKRIKYLREEKDFSQLEFSKLLNISNSTLSQYEAGNRMPGDEIKKKIANYFNVSLDYLMGASDIRNPYKEESNIPENPTLKQIEGLSEESLKELEQYIRLLKIKDNMDKTKDEQSSALEREA